MQFKGSNLRIVSNKATTTSMLNPLREKNQSQVKFQEAHDK